IRVVTLEKLSFSLDLAWFPDGKSIVNIESDKGLVRWDVETGKAINRYQGAGSFSGVDVSPDGLLVAASAHSGTAQFWKHDKSRTTRRIDVKQDCFRFLAFTPDGKGMITGGDSEAPALWGLEKEKKIRTFPGTK